MLCFFKHENVSKNLYSILPLVFNGVQFYELFSEGKVFHCKQIVSVIVCSRWNNELINRVNRFNVGILLFHVEGGNVIKKLQFSFCIS